MKIDKINITGYRRFKDSTINLDYGNFSVLAGANNSGKTSLVQLLDYIFNNNSKKLLKFNDFSIEMKTLLDEKIENLSIDLSNKEEEFLQFLKYIGENIRISVKLSISYKKDESIGLFANYLMDLESDMTSFFFEYIYKFNIDKIKKDFTQSEVRSKEKLREIIESSTEGSYFYSDENFSNKRKIDYNEFKNLFNFEYVSADRELDDESLKNKKITTTIISSTDPKKISMNWENEFNQLEKSIQKNLTDSGIKEKFQERTEEALEDLKENLDNVSKNEINALTADFDFNGKTLLNLLKNSIYISYAHKSGEFRFNLSEESQGLGVSNLIYISLQINSFSRKIKESGANTVNLFVIEEPEAHMHIQMQKVLVDYIDTIFKDNRNIQGVITTHSTEIVKNVDINNVKVIRSQNNYMNRIVDLHQFIEKNKDREFYETFFKLNFADLIFSDAVIFYEGDAERMYFERLVTRKNTKYLNLSRQYISYCQCGGAHAHKYFPLVTELGMKACVFTDIDYGKERDSLDEIQKDKTTNSTLNSLLKSNNKNVGEIYKQQKFRRNKNIEVFTQTQNDGYARTLEEAIIYKLIIPTSKYGKEDRRKYKSNLNYGRSYSGKSILDTKYYKKKIRTYNTRIDYGKNHFIKLKLQNKRGVFIEFDREFWENLKCESKLDFSVPSIKNKKLKGKVLINTRDIVNSLIKTNFMYSIIMNNKEIEVLPNYIEEGLSWLNKQISIG
ncbi:ATP-dependent nuclease [Streptococcus henryi]|uniref:ATP-dependent nuclease n=1 Tax=Streptococcus henryi TaxID=439219 RepID=UPI000381C9F9|nr:AAA family ATPase [Streptococcus henryi]